MNRFLGLKFLGLIMISSVAWGFSQVPPVRRSNVPVDDNSANCTACHRGTDLNGDARGSVTIEMSDTYQPGVAQTIRVRVRHPEAVRWGFQMTARLSSDLTKKAGTFEQGTLGLSCGGTTPTPPCGDATEFISHNGAPRGEAGAGFTFEFRWNPPTSEVGEITFFAVGNAANGSNTNVGDFIYSTNKKVNLDPAAACNNPRPVLSRIVNGASFQPGGAPRALVTIFGSGLQQAGRTRAVGAGDIVNNAFPKELGCLAIEVGGTRAPVLYAQQDQVNFQLPEGVNAGPTSVVVIANPGKPNELRSDQGTLQATTTNPAWFTLNGASIAATSADGTQFIGAVTGTRAARPGEVITLYGTGFGVTDPASAAGSIASGQARVTGAMTITVGGTQLAAADILYVGLAPGLINGLYQANIRLPATLANGNVPVVITVGGNQSQAATAGGVIPVQAQ